MCIGKPLLVFWIPCATAASPAFLRPSSLLRHSLLPWSLAAPTRLAAAVLDRCSGAACCCRARCSSAVRCSGARCCRARLLLRGSLLRLSLLQRSLLQRSLLPRALAAAERAVSQCAGARKNPRARNLSPRPTVQMHVAFSFPSSVNS